MSDANAATQGSEHLTRRKVQMIALAALEWVPRAERDPVPLGSWHLLGVSPFSGALNSEVKASEARFSGELRPPLAGAAEV